jgi:purine-binding chemotaxis protein CheW
MVAFSIRDVIETMRPLPLKALAGGHATFAGLALIRGAPTPVVDGHALLESNGSIGRFVTLRIGARTVALAVSAVLAVREIAEERWHELPPLLRDGIVSSLASLDDELVVVLRAARALPEAEWPELAS